MRRLLNVVSGRAPDSNGRVSEPLVKEELAIVEFLTAKTNAAPSSSSSVIRETPVDLLLGLAKTRSGRRAAEEERRQLRQQAAREVQEQSASAAALASGSGGQQRGGMSSSPWGYKPPSMPGLDVVQPFDMSGHRRDGPRPLQPPPTKRGPPPSGNVNGNGNVPQTNWSPDFNMNHNNNNNNGDMIRPSSSHSYHQQQSPENMFNNSPNQQQQIQSQHPNFNLDSLTNNNNNGSSNGYQLSPYQQSLIPINSPQSQQHMTTGSGDPFAGSLEQFFNNTSGNMGPGGSGGGSNQFGNAVLDQFDFTNLGLDLENGPVGLGGNGGFNPFALPQVEAEG